MKQWASCWRTVERTTVMTASTKTSDHDKSTGDDLRAMVLFSGEHLILARSVTHPAAF